MDDKTAIVLAAMAIAKPAVETACRLFEQVFGAPCEVAGDILADQLRAWQWANRIKIAEKAAKLMEESKIAPKVLPKGFLLEFFDAAGNAEDETIQGLFAKLLVSSVEHADFAQPSFVNAVRQMTPDHARTLLKHGPKPNGATTMDDLDASDVCLLHLGILHVVTVGQGYSGMEQRVCFSPFGKYLLVALGIRPAEGSRPEPVA